MFFCLFISKFAFLLLFYMFFFHFCLFIYNFFLIFLYIFNFIAFNFSFVKVLSFFYILFFNLFILLHLVFFFVPFTLRLRSFHYLFARLSVCRLLIFKLTFFAVDIDKRCQSLLLSFFFLFIFACNSFSSCALPFTQPHTHKQFVAFFYAFTATLQFTWKSASVNQCFTVFQFSFSLPLLQCNLQRAAAAMFDWHAANVDVIFCQ